LLTAHGAVLAKPHLLRIGRLLVLLESDCSLSLSTAAMRVFFRRSIETGLTFADLAVSEWQWLWRTDWPSKEGQHMQQHMVEHKNI